MHYHLWQILYHESLKSNFIPALIATDEILSSFYEIRQVN